MSRLRISRNFGESGSALFLSALCIVVTLLLCSSVPAATDRPRAGQGIVFIRPAFPEQAEEMKTIMLYETPGIDRIGMVDAARLPSLLPSVSPPPGVFAVAATEKRGNWFRVAYDDAGREGWIQGRRFWDYFSWSDFLPGRFAVLLPDLRVSLTDVHQEPLDGSPSLGRISPGERVHIVEIRHEWLRVRGGNGLNGWLRWHDRDGKLLVAVEGGGK